MANNPPGGLHVERGDPEGSTVFFSMQADDGILFEFLLLPTVAVVDLATGNVSASPSA